jgi:hypothetical protein
VIPAQLSRAATPLVSCHNRPRRNGKRRDGKNQLTTIVAEDRVVGTITAQSRSGDDG